MNVAVKTAATNKPFPCIFQYPSWSISQSSHSSQENHMASSYEALSELRAITYVKRYFMAIREPWGSTTTNPRKLTVWMRVLCPPLLGS